MVGSNSRSRGVDMDFRTALADMLRKSGWSQADVARKSGVAASQISAYLTGKKRKPELETLWKLADGFNVTIDELVGRCLPVQDERTLRLAQGFNQLDEEGRAAVMEMLDFQMSKHVKKNVPDRRLPRREAV